MTTITLPAVRPGGPAFRDAVRELAYQVGWRNAAKRIAYGPVKSETVAAFAPGGNGHSEARLLREQERRTNMYPKLLAALEAILEHEHKNLASGGNYLMDADRMQAREAIERAKGES